MPHPASRPVEWFPRLMRLACSRLPGKVPLLFQSTPWGTCILLSSLPPFLKGHPQRHRSWGEQWVRETWSLETRACKPREQRPKSLLFSLSFHISSFLCLKLSFPICSPSELLQGDLNLPLNYCMILQCPGLPLLIIVSLYFNFPFN